jgi:hypothetical protein
MEFSNRLQPLVAAAVLFSVPATAVDQTDTPEINEAQRLVFMNDALHDLGAGSVLSYDFSHRDQGTEGFSDTVEVTVTDVLDDGRRNLTFGFLTGPHHIDFHPATAYKGNPVPIQFLERDIDEMAKSTAGNAGYFQTRIRKFFAHAQAKPTRIQFQGKEVDGVEVAVTPFADDPNIDRFRSYAQKRYDFVFSDQVPGGLYQIRTLVPGPNGSESLIEDALTFRQVTASGSH